MVFLDRHGWPVEYVKGWFVRKWLRRLIHTRRIVRGRWDGHKVVR